MKKILWLNNVLFVVSSLALIIALLFVVTSYSITSVMLTLGFVAWIVTIPLLIYWNEKLESRWPWMKSMWFVITYRSVAVTAIALCVFVMLSD